MSHPTPSYMIPDSAVKPTAEQTAMNLPQVDDIPAPAIQIALSDGSGKRLYSIYCERCGRFISSFYMPERSAPFRAVFMHSVGCVCRLTLEQVEALLHTKNADHSDVRMWTSRLAGALRGLGIDPEEAHLFAIDSFPLSDAMRTRLEILRDRRKGDSPHA